MRGDLEPRAPLWRIYGVGAMALVQAQLVRDLRELIAAIDRRVPVLSRAGETAIAKDAAALRERAQTLLTQLDRDDSSAD